jgi:hypothetical protein
MQFLTYELWPYKLRNVTSFVDIDVRLMVLSVWCFWWQVPTSRKGREKWGTPNWDGEHPRALPQKYPPTIVFMTDFGVVDDSVALCRGVMYSIMPDVRIVDLTHEVTPFSILDGARFLYGARLIFRRARCLWW